MSTNTQRISALETDVAEIKAGQARMLALLEANFAAKVEVPAPPATRVTRASRPAAPKGQKVMTKGNRKSFIRANAWADGLSALDIAIALEFGYAEAKGGWTAHAYLVEKAQRATAAAKRAVKAAI